MNGKRVGAISGAVVAVAAIVGGTWVFAASGSPAPAESPSPSVSITPTPTPTATPTVEPTAAPPAPSPDATTPAVQQDQPQQEQQIAPAPEAPAAPAAPVRCPAGSSANSSDGVNDTSCFPDICFSIAVPNADHPECDVAFRP